MVRPSRSIAPIRSCDWPRKGNLMKPSVRHPLRESPYLRDVPAPFVAFVEDALSDPLCASLIARIEAESPSLASITVGGGFVVNTRVRNNERVMFDDVALAAALLERTRAFLPDPLHGGSLVGYNERFRGYRYREGQRFAPHFDGAFFRDQMPWGREGSQLTVLHYLNDGFSGGETTLIDYDVSIAPTKGSVLVFEHAILHEGCAVTDGTKYVLRTDAMYRFGRAQPNVENDEIGY
jgi:prolyl 4-hydroxylase